MCLHATAESVHRLIKAKIEEARAEPPAPTHCNCGQVIFKADETFSISTDGIRHRQTVHCWFEEAGQTIKLPTARTTPTKGALDV